MHQDQSVSKPSIVSEKMKKQIEDSTLLLHRLIRYYFFCVSEHTHTIQCIHMQY